ncbi:hypothetical protein HOE37_01570 [Candidatus Woesearchaeota archaeon]|jgi:hypothetical protein|nr:hypothetical protein [Candidatus Woesearchaeota archaeon]MBT4110524.1 hypothetical protein [Candidatus Woesearchaeota archaeon]MBT4335952.1 hypothetical protein [Candidatus Woesearchaeota archaeon]MBT4469069.1 hypothetical protein [Candidatus Woesearchaeota archaeon]MBT6744612.1 hypothetical protein [Candidatus Woesearchaeota archaeon]
MLSQFFITHVEPLHLQKGKEALFYVREQDLSTGRGKSHIRIKEVPHYFFTRNMPNDQLAGHILKFGQQPDLEHLVMEQHRISSNWSFLRTEGCKEDRKVLPHPFVCRKDSKDKRDPSGNSSPSKLLRWLYPPMMLIPSPDEIPLPLEIMGFDFNYQFAGLEHVINDLMAIADIEVRDWQIGKDSIFQMVYISPLSQIIFHDLPFNDREQEGFRLIRYPTQKELGQLTTQLIAQEDPVCLAGHNLMNYDQLQLRNITQAYFPATNEYHPVTKSAQGFGRVLTKGRFTIDTYGYFFNWLNLYVNNKIETIQEFSKSIGYDEQAALLRRAEQGDKEAFRKLTHYCIEDGKITWDLLQKVKETVFDKSLALRTSPDKISSSGRNSLGREDWKRKYFLFHGNYEEGWRRRAKRAKKGFSVEKVKNRYLPITKFPELVDFHQGMFENAHIVYFTPFVSACSEEIEMLFPELLNKIRVSQDPLEKFDWLQVLNAKLSYVVEEIVDVLDQQEGDLFQRTEWIEKDQYWQLSNFLKDHHFGLSGAVDLVNKFVGALEKTREFLADPKVDIINRGNYFYFLTGAVDLNKLREQELGIHMGQGQVLSLGKERTVSNPFGTDNIDRLIYQGYKPYLGTKFVFEKEVLRDVLTMFFGKEDPKIIHSYLSHVLDKVQSGNLPREAYFVPKKTRTYFKGLFNQAVERSERDKELKDRYAQLKRRIKDRMSNDTARELTGFTEQCQDWYCHPFLEECLEGILSPYPPTTNLVYVKDSQGILLPESMTDSLDLEFYHDKLKESLRPFIDIINS